MKLTKKIAALLLVGAATLMMAGTAHAKAPSVASDIDVWMYKDTHAECDAWKIEPATSIIPIKNLKWNAKVTNITVKGTSKVKVGERKVGTYYLPISANQHIYLNKKSFDVPVYFIVAQDGDVFKLDTTLHFVKGPSPFKTFKVGNVEYANSFAGYRSTAASEKSGRKAVKVRTADGFSYVKVVYTNKKGVAHTFANGNKLQLGNLKKIEAVYKVTRDAAIEALGGYYKKDNCANGCKNLFPVRHVATLTF